MADTANVSNLLDIVERPYLVPAHIGESLLVVTDDWRKVANVVGPFMHRSQAKCGMRLAGGCKGMTLPDKLDMIAYFVTAFNDFVGFVSSGATRMVDENGHLDPMITDVPAALAAIYGERILTLSTAPRTGDMALVDDSRLVLDIDNGILPQPGVHMSVIFQSPNADEAMEWDGDVDPYFNIFRQYVNRGGWKFGMTVWNGGAVTIDEAVKAVNDGWPVFLVQDTGRAPDQLIDLLRKGTLIAGREGLTLSDEARSRFITVQRDDPMTLARALHDNRLIAT